jgi:hypothetical protein
MQGVRVNWISLKDMLMSETDETNSDSNAKTVVTQKVSKTPPPESERSQLSRIFSLLGVIVAFAAFWWINDVYLSLDSRLNRIEQSYNFTVVDINRQITDTRAELMRRTGGSGMKDSTLRGVVFSGALDGSEKIAWMIANDDSYPADLRADAEKTLESIRAFKIKLFDQPLRANEAPADDEDATTDEEEALDATVEAVTDALMETGEIAKEANELGDAAKNKPATATEGGVAPDKTLSATPDDAPTDTPSATDEEITPATTPAAAGESPA